MLGFHSKLRDRGDGLFLFDEADFEEIECLMPNGIVLCVRVHPGDWLYHIKEAVLEKATTDGNGLDIYGTKFCFSNLNLHCSVARLYVVI